MHPALELSPDGHLLARRQVETPDGLRETVTDLTGQAHHELDNTVRPQDGTRLSAVLELLKANDALREIYTRHWAHDYVARYEAIRSGQVVPSRREHADPQEPEMASLVLSRHQEVRLPSELLATIAAARDPHCQSPTHSPSRYLNWVDGGGSPHENAPPATLTIKESSSYWHLSGRSVPFTQDTVLWGAKYKAGSHIDYSVSFSFDRCIDLPLRIGAGVMSLDIIGKRRKDRLLVSVPLGADHEPPAITLHELIGAIIHDFSFHGGPDETQVAAEQLRQRGKELDDAHHAEDLSFGMARMYCPDDNLLHREAHAQELQVRARYWDRARVIEHTGWTEAELESRLKQGRVLELSAFATRATPHRDAYPAEQFIPGFDAELLRFLNWLASSSCSEWATHTFLTEWTTPNLQGELINGWAVLALPDAPLTHEELTDPTLKTYGNRRAPMRPVFAPNTPKRALVDAYEAFAAQRRRDYEQRDELEDEE
jgi:hypothetical protein